MVTRRLATAQQAAETVDTHGTRPWYDRLTFSASRRSGVMAALVAVLVCASAALSWLGFQAIRQWRDSTEQLEGRRAEEKLALMAAALSRDMKGAHVSVLAALEHDQLIFDQPHDLADLFARALARFPYPESFFVWRRAHGPDGDLWFFDRADRRPTWASSVDASADLYPVTTTAWPPAARPIVEMALRQFQSDRTFASFEMAMGGGQYQVVVRRFLDESGRGRLFGLVGYTVNLDWVRHHYFSQIARQVSVIGGDSDLSVAVLDASGTIVTPKGNEEPPILTRARTFPLLFLDPSRIPTNGRTQASGNWTLRVEATGGTRLSATRTSQRLFTLIALAAGASIFGLVLTVRAVRATARLAALRSEFVSIATHEFRTPLSAIRLVSESLAMGRYSSPDTVNSYARMLSQEVSRLARLVDNLLTYAKLNDARSCYRFEPTDLVQLAEEALERCHVRLSQGGYHVNFDPGAASLRVLGDCSALGLVLDNLLDNAIKYSPHASCLTVDIRAQGSRALVRVSDEGNGILEDERSSVFEKFVRGRLARAPGNGLGLAIVLRVITDHQGQVDLRPGPGRGTVVEIALPLLT